MCEGVTHAAEPVEALPLGCERPAPSRLGRHVADLQVFEAMDLPPVLAGVRQVPETPMDVQQASALAFHDRKYDRDLGRPDAFGRMLVRIEDTSETLPGEPLRER